MFAALEGTIDQQRERRREARRCELRSLFAQEARIKQRVTQIVREAEDDEDWQAAGCSSNAQWLAQIAGSDYRSAVRITRATSSAAPASGPPSRTKPDAPSPPTSHTRRPARRP